MIVFFDQVVWRPIVAWSQKAQPAVPLASTATAANLRLPALTVTAVAPAPETMPANGQRTPMLSQSVVAPAAEPQTTLADAPLAPSVTITVERRGDIVLVGLNRPFIQNRLDPPTRIRLGETLYQYEHDPSLRAFVLFGHGEHFSRGIDVDASQAGIIAGQRAAGAAPAIDVLGNGQPRRSKPVVAVVHGDTWNLGHEIYLASDVRVAAANTRFGQDENTHGRFPGGGATVRFVREAGWGNAMRYMLTGDHWSAEESYRMGVTQQVVATPEAALEAGIAIARRIAACAPLSIKATLTSAHQYVDPVEADALSKLGAQYAALYRTEDFLEGRRAEAEGRPPKYQGK
jgi:enoyl-CoA hydratase/carnithine racemase